MPANLLEFRALYIHICMYVMVVVYMYYTLYNVEVLRQRRRKILACRLFLELLKQLF